VGEGGSAVLLVYLSSRFFTLIDLIVVLVLVELFPINANGSSETAVVVFIDSVGSFAVARE